MSRSLFGKVLWLGRATSAVAGLAILLALAIGAANSALAHTDVDNKLLHLGHSNKVGTATAPGAPTALVSTLTDAVKSALVVQNKSGGPALDLRVGSNNVAPMKVNSTKTVNNLNADQLDGKHSDAFQSSNPCPGGTLFNEGVCVEAIKRAASSIHSDAQTACLNDGRRLPTLA